MKVKGSFQPTFSGRGRNQSFLFGVADVSTTCILLYCCGFLYFSESKVVRELFIKYYLCAGHRVDQRSGEKSRETFGDLWGTFLRRIQDASQGGKLDLEADSGQINSENSKDC